MTGLPIFNIMSRTETGLGTHIPLRPFQNCLLTKRVREPFWLWLRYFTFYVLRLACRLARPKCLPG